MTGFVVWGRLAGVAVAKDGALVVAEDGQRVPSGASLTVEDVFRVRPLGYFQTAD
ncbi:hypothetical protein [Mesorhizobium sp.]|uniref:hypothetical protein n=1 Tax=Mesorhizobium sp. TaxID=1871066 RepID=UPI0025DE13F4|nr:hypothetical protein [Mesorhizobium sp.]